MGFFFSSKKKIVKNKCYGCDHYDGEHRGMVRCGIGTKVSVQSGCSSFSPDSTANCWSGTHNCYYNSSDNRSQGVNCRFHGRLSSDREYCRDHADTDEV